MKRVLIWIFLSGIIFINSGCPKPCIEANYSFIVHSHIIPDMDSISIGDSIYLISSFPLTLQDQNTGTQIDYSGATAIGSTLGVSQLVQGDSIAKDAVSNFNYFSITGTIYNDRNIASPDGVQQLVYKELNGNYELKIVLVPKVSGVYVLVIGNGLSTGRSKSRSCEKANFNITLEDTNQNFNLLYNWNPKAKFYIDGKYRVYYFKVN